jgi:hypothetical protein
LSLRLEGRNPGVDHMLIPSVLLVASSQPRGRRKAEGFYLATRHLLLSVDASGEAGDGPTAQERGGAGVLAWNGGKAGLSMVDADAALAGAVVGRLTRETPGKEAAGAGKAPAAATEMGRQSWMTEGGTSPS